MPKKFDLRRKKVIDVDTAELVGYIHDMDIDFESGKINSITIPKNSLINFFGMQKSVTLSWENIIAVGSEFVIIKQKESNIR